MKNTISIGKAGEYYVAAKMELLGFTVALPPANTEKFDLLAINRTTGKIFTIQVKTTTGKNNVWKLSFKNENIIDENLYYVFVKISDKVEYYIVKSSTVTVFIKQNHSIWLSTPSKNGQMHNDNNLREFCDLKKEYYEKWDELLR